MPACGRGRENEMKVGQITMDSIRKGRTREHMYVVEG